MANLVIVGVQGSGKGTQARLLAAEYELIHVAVGDILRAHIENDTRLGQTVRPQVEAGRLVPDDIVSQVVKTRLAEADCEHGFILDGFPRNVAQADFLLENFPVDAAIHLTAPDEVVTRRMLARRQCLDCRRDYNLLHRPPHRENLCDDCDGPVVQRPYDTAESIAERLALHHAVCGPVLALFREHEILVDIDATGSPEQVHAEIKRVVELPELV